MPRLRRPVAILCAILMLVAAAQMLWVYFAVHKSIAGPVAAVLAVGLAVGVLMDRPFALRCTAAICVLAAFILPVGILNIFAVGDYLAAGRQPPMVAASLLWVVPIVLLLLFVALLIDPPNKKRTLPWRRS